MQSDMYALLSSLMIIGCPQLNAAFAPEKITDRFVLPTGEDQTEVQFEKPELWDHQLESTQLQALSEMH